MLLIISLDAIAEYFLNSHWLFDKSSYPEFQNNIISIGVSFESQMFALMKFIKKQMF